jgi:hypothetical protein
VSQKPQFTTAIKQLQDTKLTHATQGCSVGEMPEVRRNVENALQPAILRGTDAKRALGDARYAELKLDGEVLGKLADVSSGVDGLGDLGHGSNDVTGAADGLAHGADGVVVREMPGEARFDLRDGCPAHPQQAAHGAFGPADHRGAVRGGDGHGVEHGR